ncbi:MAG: hypothetical protein IT336_12450 [Thermomicrobiales bacterium]|nr:hypothetical protein [Thermomicrobiales bacterium]
MTDKQRAPDRPATADEEIDKAAADSFPASDPPSWSGGQQHDPATIDPAAFERNRAAEEHATYGSEERHDGR